MVTREPDQREGEGSDGRDFGWTVHGDSGHSTRSVDDHHSPANHAVIRELATVPGGAVQVDIDVDQTEPLASVIGERVRDDARPAGGEGKWLEQSLDTG